MSSCSTTRTASSGACTASRSAPLPLHKERTPDARAITDIDYRTVLGASAVSAEWVHNTQLSAPCGRRRDQGRDDVMKGSLYRGISRRSILKQTGAAAIGITLAPTLEACSRGGGGGSGGRVVNFYNWDTYIGETTLADFQAATHVPVQ